MANAFQYSIGRKFIQALSGAFLIVFLLLHAFVNFLSVIDTFIGKFGISAQDTVRFSSGDGLFQWGCDFMSLPIVVVMVPILALGFVLHIAYGLYLTWINIKSRGGIKRYEVSNKAKADSWSAQNMFVLGIVILGVLFFHLTHFWAKMQLAEFTGGHASNPYDLLKQTFASPINLIIYLLWFVSIGLHLTHGFWSMFQTIGWSNQVWMKRLKILGIIVAVIIVLSFSLVAVNAFLVAKGYI